MLNIEQYRLPNGHLEALLKQTKTEKRKKRIKGKFIKGPLCLLWFSRAIKVSYGAGCLGLVLWHLAGMNKDGSLTVSLPNKIVEATGIKRDTKRRALIGLERAGLIKVSGKSGASPIVTIIVQEE
jgi:hypothetical protein